MTPDQIRKCIARKRNEYDRREISQYEHYTRELLKHGDSLPYDLTYPKHRFLSYLTDSEHYLAHGTPLTDLTLLKPVRKSKDTEPTGHEDLLLAASDAIWAMWYAILDKSRMGGLTSNDCIVKRARDGCDYSLYYFSVNHAKLAQKPFHNGAVYTLKPDTFVHELGEEKGSSESVEPLFKVDITMNDFPYLTFVKGVDVEAIKLAQQTCPEKRPWLSDSTVFPISPDIPTELLFPDVIC